MTRQLKKIFAVFCMLLFLLKNSTAKIILPELISSNMVLQQQTKVLLWGKSTHPGKLQLFTSWNKKRYIVTSEKNGDWQIKVLTPVAGGPYQISISDGEKLTLENILIGEVWVCSGQSNMEMPVRGFKNQPIENASDILADADNQAIRLFKVKRNPSLVALTACGGEWDVASADMVKDFSAIAYEYGKMLQQRLKVPVGLILSAWGGTKIETWMDRESLKAFHQIQLPDKLDPAAGDNQPPAALYNGMISPLVKYPVRGFIWYQGEANRMNAGDYKDLFPEMVKCWRRAWNLGDLPFYYVQIAPFGYADSTTASGPQIREAQLSALKVIPNSGMAVALDAGKEHYIHPPDKTTLAKRLTYWALAKTYHISGINYAGPVLRSTEVKNGHLVLYFDFAPDGLTSHGKELANFEIAGSDNIYYPAKAKILYEGLEVWSDQVKAPVNVRYAFKEWVTGDLYNTEGLPASSFRTDSLNKLSAH